MSNNGKIEIWGGERWDEVAPINELVYPPENPITKVWRSVSWGIPAQRVVVLDGGQPVCHVAVYFRDGLANGKPAKICGIGGVMTRPEQQGRHHATKALALANDLAVKRGMEFGLLVCEDKNITLYEKFGWRVFPGEMLYEQPEGKKTWSLSAVMVRDIAGKAPNHGTIDLCGKPW
jgi:hypothetical protein